MSRFECGKARALSHVVASSLDHPRTCGRLEDTDTGEEAWDCLLYFSKRGNVCCREEGSRVCLPRACPPQRSKPAAATGLVEKADRQTVRHWAVVKGGLVLKLAAYQRSIFRAAQGLASVGVAAP